ncbi:hypothetical protein D8Y24_12765 [Agrococcus lahaulensis]|nr:hypothetical protein D8Y24_12765 [Agrococcus lahaulensis]
MELDDSRIGHGASSTIALGLQRDAMPVRPLPQGAPCRLRPREHRVDRGELGLLRRAQVQRASASATSASPAASSPIAA